MAHHTIATGGTTMLTALGLVVNIIGTVLAGFLVPRHHLTTHGAGMATDAAGQRASPRAAVPNVRDLLRQAEASNGGRRPG